jgi:hypothetical protein
MDIGRKGVQGSKEQQSPDTSKQAYFYITYTKFWKLAVFLSSGC